MVIVPSACTFGSLDQLLGDRSILGDIQLEPLGSVARRGDLFHAVSHAAAHAVHGARSPGCTGGPHSSLTMIHLLSRNWCQQNGHPNRLLQHRRRRVSIFDALEQWGQNPHTAECGDVLTQGDFISRTGRDVVISRLGQLLCCQLLKVSHVDRLGSSLWLAIAWPRNVIDRSGDTF